MTLFRRDILNDVPFQPDTHAGLWLDKYLKDDGQTSKSEHVRQVAGIPISSAYEKFFRRWQNTLVELDAESHTFRTIGRLAVNLGAEGVLETSIALHRTYGVPYIPGSALKGLAAHYVTTYFEGDLKRDSDDLAWNAEMRRYMFGDTTSAGYVTFYDALLVPEDNRKYPLKPDVITVHHPHYYQGTKPEYYSEKIKLAPPADWDSPTPIPFITTTGAFLVALSSDSPKWVKAAFKILELALEREGIGAKTSSGYGRMRLDADDGKVRFIKSFDAVPKLNDAFKGKVFDVDQQAVYLNIPGLDPDEAHAYIPLDQAGSVKEDDVVNCQVVGIEKVGNTTRVICKRVKQK